MPLFKKGSPSKIRIIKHSGFSMDPNAIAEQFLKQWPSRQATMDQVHSALKSIGVINYSSEDLSELIGRLQAIGFTIEG